MIHLTRNAAEHIKRSIAKRGKGLGVRVGVKTTGCSGLAYVIEYVDHLQPEDEVFVHDDLKIVIDQKSLVYLDGTEMDYVKQGFSEGFEFKNPNEAARCGCGESFTIDTKVDTKANAKKAS